MGLVILVGALVLVMLISACLLLLRSRQLGEGKIALGAVGLALVTFVIVIAVFGVVADPVQF